MLSHNLKAVICSPDIYPDSVKKLNSYGIEVLSSCKCENVLPPLSNHTDLQIAKIEENLFVCAPQLYEYYNTLLSKFKKKLIKGNTYLSCNYPGDIAYNIIVTGKYAIHNFDHTDDIIKEEIKHKEKINVRQGYTGCTMRLISENVAITSDSGIYKILTSKGFDVLFVNDKNILLPGFEHGFFGGSSFMLSPSVLAVNGNIEFHNDCKAITDFCSNYGVSVLSLSNECIMDIGSVITL